MVGPISKSDAKCQIVLEWIIRQRKSSRMILNPDWRVQRYRVIAVVVLRR
jgi:hypothetical protein